MNELERAEFLIELYQELNPDAVVTGDTVIRGTSINKLAQTNAGGYNRVKNWLMAKASTKTQQKPKTQRAIKMAYIVPTEYINSLGSAGDFHLVLSHLMDERIVNQYESEMVKSGKTLILDNGTFENGVPEEVGSLLAKARRIGARCVFAPDYLYDAKKTNEAFERMYLEAIRTGAIEGGLKIAKVIQADTVGEYVDEYIKCAEDDRIGLLGISILTIPHITSKIGMPEIDKGRVLMLSILNLLPKHRKSHLLGLGDSYADVLYAQSSCDWVVSNDTSCCFQNGLEGKRLVGPLLTVEGGKSKIKVNFKQNDVSRVQYYDIQNNIMSVKSKINHADKSK